MFEGIRNLLFGELKASRSRSVRAMRIQIEFNKAPHKLAFICEKLASLEEEQILLHHGLKMMWTKGPNHMAKYRVLRRNLRRYGR